MEAIPVRGLLRATEDKDGESTFAKPDITPQATGRGVSEGKRSKELCARSLGNEQKPKVAFLLGGRQGS